MVCIARTVVGSLVVSTHCRALHGEVHSIAVRHDAQLAAGVAHLVVAEQRLIYQGIVDVGDVGECGGRGIIVVHNDVAQCHMTARVQRLDIYHGFGHHARRVAAVGSRHVKTVDERHDVVVVVSKRGRCRHLDAAHRGAVSRRTCHATALCRERGDIGVDVILIVGAHRRAVHVVRGVRTVHRACRQDAAVDAHTIAHGDGLAEVQTRVVGSRTLHEDVSLLARVVHMIY